MADLQKVMQGLECCSMNGKGCRQCPYNKDCDEMPDYGNAHLCSDALELLKSMSDPSVHRFTPAEVFFEMVHSSWEDDRFGPDKPARYTPAEVLGILMAIVITEGERNGENQ